MRWNEDTQQLITCSKDKTVKIWELPDAWVDESNEKALSEEKPKYIEPPKAVHKFASALDTGVKQSIWPKDMKYEQPANLMQKEESKK